MKRTLKLIISVSAASIMAMPTLAEDTSKLNTGYPYGTRDMQHGTRDMQRERYAEQINQVIKVSDLIGMTVMNRKNETLGKVADLSVDVESGRIVVVILASGGFLGMGEELSAVPPTALRLKTDQKVLELDATKEVLSNAPHFKAKDWPDFGQAANVQEVYHAYQVEPYFSTKAMTAAPADKAAPHQRGFNDRNPMPPVQGNSKADLATTAQIRKEIKAASGLSVNAQNVKVITRDGRVHLSGAVDNAGEKVKIGEIASRIARAEIVDNQIEVQSDASTASMRN